MRNDFENEKPQRSLRQKTTEKWIQPSAHNQICSAPSFHFHSIMQSQAAPRPEDPVPTGGTMLGADCWPSRAEWQHNGRQQQVSGTEQLGATVTVTSCTVSQPVNKMQTVWLLIRVHMSVDKIQALFKLSTITYMSVFMSV